MLGLSLTFFLCLVSTSAVALSNDIGTAAGPLLIGQAQGSTIERELAGYLDDDDIVGANAFVDRLVADGAVDEAEQRILEDRIWRTKTERTLDYARKIREAIRDSDLETMRDYNARMQRLMGKTPGSEPLSPVAEADAEESGVPPSSVETGMVTPELDRPDEVLSDEEAAEEEAAEAEAEEETGDVIEDLLRRGENAIATYNLTVATPGTDSAVGMLDQLVALGGEGEAAAKTLGQKIMAVYATLIERNIGRGRLDKARTFAERMRTVAKRPGLPLDEVDALSARIDQVSAKTEEHDHLLQQAARLRDRGQLVAPDENHALAFAAEALELDVDRAAAGDLLDDIILRQRRQADQLAETGRLRDAAHELETLADALIEADIGEAALITGVRGDAAALYRRADLRDSERERRAAAEARSASETPAEDEGSRNPLTFINPF